MATTADEQRHAPGPELWWNESWYFDFAASDASIGGYVRLGLYPNQRVAWWWACLAGADRSLVTLRAHDIEVPRTGTEIRSDGLWSCLTAETPLQHWSVGMESFAVTLDDPAQAYHGERGDRVAFGLDLEWEAVGPTYDYPGVSRYEQSCQVSGEILLGDERIEFVGPGQRDHSWGVRDWWTVGWCWTSGALDDGSRFHAMRLRDPALEYQPSYLIDPAGTLASLWDFDVETTLGGEDLPVSASMHLGPLELAVTPVGMAPLLLEDGAGRVSRFPRALCRLAAADGRHGVSWTEWNQPPGLPPA